MNNSLSLETVLNNKSNYNLAIPFTESQQINPFYKISISPIFVDTSSEASEIYKVGSKRTDGNRYEDVYSLTKPFLQKLATQAGIQFAPESGDVVKVDENTWKASAYGALKLPDGTIRTSNNFKVIDLVTEEKKYRIAYEEKAEKGIVDYKAAKEAAEKYAGEWLDTGKKNDNGYPVRKYIIEEHERGKYIENSLLDAMTQLRANAPQKAATGAILRVIRDLLGIKSTYTMNELKKPFAVARMIFSPDYNDPVIRQMLLQQAIQSVGNIFGNMAPVVQTISIPKNAEEEIDIPSDITAEYGSRTDEAAPEEIALDEEDRSCDFCCDKCGIRIDENVWNYSYEKYSRPLCVKCQKAEENANAEYSCHHCGVKINKNVYQYSVNKYGRPLCMKCQKGAGK